ILQKDYYRLQAFFAGMVPVDAPLATRKDWAEQQLKAKIWEEKTAGLRAQLDTLEKAEKTRLQEMMIAKFPLDIQAMMRKASAERTPLEKQLAALAFRQVQYEWDNLKLKDAEKKKVDAL